MGRVDGPSAAAIPADRLLILGADGHRRCAAAYERLVPHGSAVTSFGHLWGSFPTATAFDAAAAALILRDGRTPAPPPGTADPGRWRMPAAGEPLPAAGLGLLRVSGSGEYALTLMQRS
jgi:3-oxoacyl-[acyl-carrier-protein] synthase II